MTEEIIEDSSEKESTNELKTYVYTLFHKEEMVMQFMLTTTSDKDPELLFEYFSDLYNIILFNYDELYIETI